MWEGVGDWTELEPHSYGHNRVSFPFSWAAQPGAWGPTQLGVGFLYRILSPTDWTSCAPSYIIIWLQPSFCERHKSHPFNPSTVKVIFWYSSTGCTCYLHRCISYFDSSARLEVNIQHCLMLRTLRAGHMSWWSCHNLSRHILHLFSCTEWSIYGRISL